MDDYTRWDIDHYANENVFMVNLKELEKFRDCFAVAFPRRLIGRYDPRRRDGRLVHPSAPTALEYINTNLPYSAPYNRRFVSTGFGLPYPPERKRALAEIVDGILLLAQARKIPLIEGNISLNEGWGGEEDETVLSFVVDAYGLQQESDSSAMMNSLRQWRETVEQELSPHQSSLITYSFSRINNVDHYQDDSGEHVTNGYFSIKGKNLRTEEKPSLEIIFSGYALPMAKQLLSKDNLSFPLSQTDAQQLQEALLASLEPLRRKGYRIQPWKSPYNT